MPKTTVSDLAKLVGAPVERLLRQMQEAGLPQKTADEAVSDDNKQVLLAFLKNSHGEVSEAPKKITLKRKTLSTLKAGQGKKTVAVEVRKKRTYVKRDLVEDVAPEVEVALETPVPASVDALVEDVAVAAPAPEPVQEEVVEVVEAAVAEVAAAVEAPETAEVPEPEAEVEAPVEAAQEEVVVEVTEPVVEAAEEVVAPVEEPVVEAPVVEAPKKEEFDPEKLRLAAAERRRKTQAAAEEAHNEKLAAIKQREIDGQRKIEEAKQKREAEKAKLESVNASAAKRTGTKPKTTTEAPKPAEDNRLGKKRKAKTAGGGDERRPARRGRNTGGARTTDHSLHMNVNDKYEDAGGELRMHRRKKKHHPELEKHGFEKPVEKKVIEVEISDAISVTELAQRMAIKSGEVIKYLFSMGSMVTINQVLDQDTATLVIEEFGHVVKVVSENALEEDFLDSLIEEGDEEPRAPVVTVMGHVDHGKTSLLDYIRKAKVADGEAGGITQHIGAYHVETDKGMISFLDTPGHAAFTAMRARGAQSTDIVILVVAADDGVMPQTEEAVKHSRAAGVPIVVAVNKMDKEGADPDRVKNELSALDVIPDDWGGDVQFVPVAAHSGEGIDDLLDAILLQAELLELTAAKDIAASGVVIESSLDKGRGPVANLMIQRGTLRKGDIVLAGEQFGRVRAMLDENGKQIEQAGPSIPVQILGLGATADAGDTFVVVENEKRAREIASHRADKMREQHQARQHASKLDNMFSSMSAGEVKVLNIVVKTDVRGSLEALRSSLMEIGNDEVKVNIISGGVGGITESDMNLAITSSAVVFGFNVRADNSAKALAEKEGVDYRYYSVIYDLLDDVTSALNGMLAPELREEILGVAEVKDTFSSPKFGQIAGCIVVEGTVYRSKPIRVLRDDIVIYEGELESLRRFKDDVNEVRSGTECGIGVKNYDVRIGDKIEVFDTTEIARTL